MIFKKNKYNRYTPLLESDMELAQVENDIQWLDFDDDSQRKSGWEGLKDRIMDAVRSIKNKALNAMGMKDGFSIRSCIAKLKGLLGRFLDRVKETVKTWTPAIKNFINKVCDYIQDAIDYIKGELS